MNNPAIGFIGLGHMGRHMALRILQSGRPLVVYDVREDVVEEFLKLGAQPGDSPRAVADLCETVMVSLPTPNVVREVALGPQGIQAGQAVSTYIDLSTTGRKVADEVAEALLKRGVDAVDAPVSGGPPGARLGTLAVMVACPVEVFSRVRPLLEIIGKNVVHVGEKPGQGQIVKLANNLLSAAAVVVTSEAMVMTSKAGLDPATVLEVINTSSGRNTATQDKFPKVVLNGRFDYGFQLGLMHKDLKLCLDEAEALGVPMWVGTMIRQFLTFALTQGQPEDDITSVVRWIEGWAGAEVRS